MLTLAIDTATEDCSVALGQHGKAIREGLITAGRSHLELLLPEIDRLLTASGRCITNIEAIVAGIGPGTFSGLRVGVATARALAQTLQVPIAASGTLQCLAAGMLVEVDTAETGGSFTLLPVIDARRGQVFAQMFKPEGKRLVGITDIVCMDPRALIELIAAENVKPLIAAGNGVLAHYELFSSSAVLSIPAPDHEQHRVYARHHLLPVRDFGEYNPVQAARILPRYIREPDADKSVLLRKQEPWLK